MLSFDSTLSSALKLSNTTAFWVLKLYYNDESNFIGLSDIDRNDGSDFYHGLISSWGNYSQSLDFYNFTTSTSNITIKIINADMSITGGRFSDLLSSYNFANRKWELFLNTNQAGTYDTAARMIGTGIISGEIKYDYNSIGFTLLDISSKKHKQVPSSVVTSSSYPNAPDKNLNKPIPMSYGDFYEKTAIGTIPTTHCDRLKQFYNSAFPAIITDKFDIGENAVEAHIDSQAMHTLDNENVYYYKSSQYSTATGTVDATSGNPKIEFTGGRAKVYIPLSASNFTVTQSNGSGSSTNVANMVNGDFSDSSVGTISISGGSASTTGSRTISFGIPQVSKLGEFVSANAVAKLGTLSGATSAGNHLRIGSTTLAYSSISSNDEVVASQTFTDAEKSSWEFESKLDVKLESVDGDLSAEIIELGLIIEFDLDNIESYETLELYETTLSDATGIKNRFFFFSDILNNKVTLTRTKTHIYPSEIDYVYASGKGRKYGAWVDADSRDNGYNQNDLIENPVYIIEDILRTELSMSSSDIDYTTFDTAGNSTNGHITEPFNDAVGDIKFAFSQHKFIDSKDLINRICRQIFSWVWFSANGKIKIRTLLRPGDSFTTDKTIDFNEINLKSINKTPLNSVRNDITIKYNYDYGQRQNLSEVNTVDSGSNSSQSTDVEGFGQSLELEMDAECVIDTTTATQMADGYKAIMKDRKILIDFNIANPKYNDLEITDHIQFSNWDSNLKLYGASYSSDVFIITSISKKVNGCSIKAIKVDD